MPPLTPDLTNDNQIKPTSLQALNHEAPIHRTIWKKAIQGETMATDTQLRLDGTCLMPRIQHLLPRIIGDLKTQRDQAMQQ